jgi:site-specific DNA-methyltransferase (adenine-specific)
VRGDRGTPRLGRTGPNALYYGDNLDVMRRHVGDATVDLVYLDTPFDSDVNYNVLFREHGEKAAAQIEAFSDTWEWNTEAAAAYQDVVERETPPCGTDGTGTIRAVIEGD